MSLIIANSTDIGWPPLSSKVLYTVIIVCHPLKSLALFCALLPVVLWLFDSLNKQKDLVKAFHLLI